MGSRLNILYLEGDNFIHCGFTGFLENLGMNVKKVSSANSLLTVYHESQINPFNIFGGEKFDLIIFDVFTSLNNSIEIIKVLKSYKNCPILVALTTPEQSFMYNNYLDKGFDQVMNFPVIKDEFLKQIKQWTSSYEDYQEQLKPDEVINNEIEVFPVVSLKTYSAILDQAERNNFSILKVYNEFLDELEGLMKKFIIDFENNEHVLYKVTVCSIRGLCVTMGASQVYHLASNIESLIQNGETGDIGKLLPFLIEKFLILQDFIRQWKEDPFEVVAA